MHQQLYHQVKLHFVKPCSQAKRKSRNQLILQCNVGIRIFHYLAQRLHGNLVLKCQHCCQEDGLKQFIAFARHIDRHILHHSGKRHLSHQFPVSRQRSV